MTDETTQKTFEILSQFRYAPVALAYAKGKNKNGIKKSLEMLVSDLHISGNASTFVNGIFDDEDGFKRGVEVANRIYEEALGGLNMNKFYEFYSANMASVTDEDKTTIKQIFEDNQELTVKKLEEEVKKAKRASDDPINQKEAEDAQKTIEKYRAVYSAYAMLREDALNNLMKSIAGDVRKKDYAELAKKYRDRKK